ncbi:NSP5 [Rotavirus F chicken/03V0568/DEU/2003]|uniref:NSP5 n=1 Tax=Rotavirus F chicken/03V0568/DEU/2003 TaxID=994994 RepID=M4H296_9REOV|nr:NSP5 [Rotavirus F chicken/03V0568/DEU/2003]AFL91892.1 NSP5 [Rotavirus F chicken/03V0568/DEU/2003]
MSMDLDIDLANCVIDSSSIIGGSNTGSRLPFTQAASYTTTSLAGLEEAENERRKAIEYSKYMLEKQDLGPNDSASNDGMNEWSVSSRSFSTNESNMESVNNFEINLPSDHSCVSVKSSNSMNSQNSQNFKSAVQSITQHQSRIRENPKPQKQYQQKKRKHKEKAVIDAISDDEWGNRVESFDESSDSDTCNNSCKCCKRYKKLKKSVKHTVAKLISDL